MKTALRRGMFATVLVGLLAMAGIALAASNTTVTSHGSTKGRILANSRGFSLYMFAKDKQGGKGKAAKSNCYGDCAKAWPPLLVSKGGKPVAAGGVNSKLLGTTRRKDGKVEVTYNGWPLYTYVVDKKPGNIKGEGVVQFGAAWYVLNTKGQLVKNGNGNGCPAGYVKTSSGCLPQTY